MSILFINGSPEKEEMLHRGEFTMSRFASLYGMEYMGMATTEGEASSLSANV